MLTDEKKKRIESLTPEEMLYEINLGPRSRFQGDKFAYLKTCYELRISNAQIAANKTIDETNAHQNRDKKIFSKPITWYDKILVKIAVGVIIVILSLAVVWIINHYLNLGL